MQRRLTLSLGLVLLLSSFLLAAAYKSGSREDSSALASGSWQTVEAKGLSLMRLAVPEGWLVKASGDHHPQIFVYDPDFSWRRRTSGAWDQLDLEGGALQRLQLPLGWLVTSKNTSGPIHLTFIYDRLHGWSPQP